MKWYFAFGSNMSSKRIKDRIGRFPERVPGLLNDFKLVFNKKAGRNADAEGYASVVPAAGSKVEGILYQLTDDEFKVLNRYEGVSSGHYQRDNVEVIRTDNNERVDAIIYVACARYVSDKLKPSREYLNYLLEGKDCLSKGYYARLKNTEYLD